MPKPNSALSISNKNSHRYLASSANTKNQIAKSHQQSNSAFDKDYYHYENYPDEVLFFYILLLFYNLYLSVFLKMFFAQNAANFYYTKIWHYKFLFSSFINIKFFIFVAFIQHNLK